MNTYRIGFLGAFFLVIANMIGTGIFTSLGYQLVGLHSVLSIMLLWFIGGVVALCGAFVYAELGSLYPRSGGEYNLLSQLYHPSLGFVAGWVSLTVGFAAPTALSAIAFGTYIKTIFPSLSVQTVSIVIVLFWGIIHSTKGNYGNLFQNVLTFLKILLMLALIGVGFTSNQVQDLSFFNKDIFHQIFSNSFATSLIYVTYAYSGWNAVIYIIGDLENPKRDLSKSLIWGTVVVTILYLLVNYIFLYTTPMELMIGKIEVGFIVGNSLLGNIGAKVIAGLIAFFLLSMIGSMIYIAPRITREIGLDYKVLKSISLLHTNGIPLRALWLQIGLILFFILSSSFESILMYSTFILVLVSVITVFGLFITRKKNMKGSYKAWGHPFTTIVFLVLNCWVLFFLLFNKTKESLIGLLILALGLFLYSYSENYLGSVDKD